MQIDWITAGAQIVNFLILVYLLKRFLYRPVLDAMDRREQRIAGRLSEAAEREQAAEREAEDYRAQRRELEEQRQQMLERVESEAEDRRRELMEAARRAAEQAREQYLAEVEREKDTFVHGLRQTAVEEIVRVARAVLGELADADLEQSAVRRFIERLGEADEQTRCALANAASIRVATSFELGETLTSELRDALARLLDREPELTFKHTGSLLAGIELTADGHRLSWTIDAYLDRLAERVERQLGTERS